MSSAAGRILQIWGDASIVPLVPKLRGQLPAYRADYQNCSPDQRRCAGQPCSKKDDRHYPASFARRLPGDSGWNCPCPTRSQATLRKCLLVTPTPSGSSHLDCETWFQFAQAFLFFLCRCGPAAVWRD